MTKLSVPAGPLHVMASAIAHESGVPVTWVFGPEKSQTPQAVRARWQLIREAHERWPRASFSSIAHSLGLSRATVLNVLGRRKKLSTGSVGGRPSMMEAAE